MWHSVTPPNPFLSRYHVVRSVQNAIFAYKWCFCNILRGSPIHRSSHLWCTPSDNILYKPCEWKFPELVDFRAIFRIVWFFCMLIASCVWIFLFFWGRYLVFRLLSIFFVSLIFWIGLFFSRDFYLVFRSMLAGEIEVGLKLMRFVEWVFCISGGDEYSWPAKFGGCSVRVEGAITIFGNRVTS